MKGAANRGLFVLRAQPIHKGHVEAIQSVLREVDELVIAIGSAQLNYTPENPFTVGERIEMLRAALDEAGIDARRIIIVPVPDIHSHRTWVSHVISFSPRFGVVYSNNPTVVLPFKDAGYKVRPLPPFNRKEYSSTNIRQRIATDKRWEDLVPASVVGYIREIGGEERIRTLTRSKWI
ncbi:MAG: nicotinamide-nucleotide adenylyltransferase [Candidatus Bathyarchaeia archaeon]